MAGPSGSIRGSDEPVALNDLAGHVAAAMGVERAVVHLAPRREVTHIHAAHDRVRRVFGSRPATPLPEGLAAMARWVRAWGARAGTPFEGIEVERNLPASWRRR